MAGHLTTLSPTVMWKVENVTEEPNNLARFLVKMLTLPPTFFLLIIVKCERRIA